MTAFLRRVVSHLMIQDLRKAFRRVCWVGHAPDFPPGIPIVLYTNHHNFFDGHLAWLVIRRMLNRRTLTWMADWDRFPFFSVQGALPFPADDAKRRAETIRSTVRRFRESSPPVLVYFPEGHLHTPDDGVMAFDHHFLSRLDRLLPEKMWWPVAIHVTWAAESLPTVFLAGGEPHARIDGEEKARLETLLRALRNRTPDSLTVLLEGRHSPQERWNFAFLSRFFKP